MKTDWNPLDQGKTIDQISPKSELWPSLNAAAIDHYHEFVASRRQRQREIDDARQINQRRFIEQQQRQTGIIIDRDRFRNNRPRWRI